MTARSTKIGYPGQSYSRLLYSQTLRACVSGSGPVCFVYVAGVIIGPCMSINNKCSAMCKVKKVVLTFYIAQYPVRWTAKKELYTFCPPWQTCSFRHQLGLSQLGRQWRERKCPIFETVAKGDSNPGSLECESGILPLSYRAP